MSDVKLYNDDCMKVLPSLADGSISLTLTDIPYDEVNRKSGGLRNLDKSHADIITFPLDDFIDEVVRVTHCTDPPYGSTHARSARSCVTFSSGWRNLPLLRFSRMVRPYGVASVRSAPFSSSSRAASTNPL